MSERGGRRMGHYAITGVASGIGAELVRLLTARGYRVTGFDIFDPGEAVVRFIPVDMRDPDAIDAAVAAAGTEAPFDGLCNNAGLPPREGLEAAILQVNYLGPRRFTRAMLDRLAPGASIVNMASRAGARWRETVAQVRRLTAIADPGALAEFVAAEGIDPVRAYDLSKEAMILWTMAETEPMIARGGRINSVSPGAVATGLLDDFARAFGERMAVNLRRAGRPGSPAEAAEVAAFLLSPDSFWIKGQDIVVDGGMAAFNAADQLGFGDLRL
jgi:NAD(P)-dependent dehydrogenase (short-subunit alcohol dehydrogenase family)